jgi:hypothetical protein
VTVKVPFSVAYDELIVEGAPLGVHLRAVDAWRDCGVWVTDQPLGEILRMLPQSRAKLWSEAAKSLPMRRDSAAGRASRATTLSELGATARVLKVVCLSELKAAEFAQSSVPEVTSLKGFPDCRSVAAARASREQLVLKGTRLVDVWSEWFDVAASLPGLVVVADPFALVSGARGERALERFIGFLVNCRGHQSAIELQLLSSVHERDPRISVQRQRAWARDIQRLLRKRHPVVNLRIFEVPDGDMIHFRYIRIDRLVFKLDKGLALFADESTGSAYDISVQGLGNFSYVEKMLTDRAIRIAMEGP